MVQHHPSFLFRHQLTGLQPEGQTGWGREGCVPAMGSLPSVPTPREGGNRSKAVQATWTFLQHKVPEVLGKSLPFTH